MSAENFGQRPACNDRPATIGLLWQTQR